MNVTDIDLTEALVKMLTMIPGFPATDMGAAMVREELTAMVNSREELQWLTITAIRQMDRFSLKELRRIFCARYKPADGREMDEPTAETRYIQSETREYEAKRTEWRREYKKQIAAAGAADSAVLPEPVLGVPQPPSPKEVMDEKIRQEKERVSLAQAEKDLADQIASTPKRTEEETLRLIKALQDTIRKPLTGE